MHLIHGYAPITPHLRHTKTWCSSCDVQLFHLNLSYLHDSVTIPNVASANANANANVGNGDCFKTT